MSQIDRRVDDLMSEATRQINAGDTAPAMGTVGDKNASLVAVDPNTDPNSETLTTINPTAESLIFQQLDRSEITETSQLVDRLERHLHESDNAMQLDLAASLAYAQQHSREYRFAEEDYILQALRTLIERHQWGPRFFDTISADFDANGNNGLYDSSLSLVNDLSVTQRLPYGGEISARALASATEDLHQFVAGERTNSMDLIFSADLPLLRGAGTVARESLIQANRDMVYAARDFERFRREFLVDISSTFLDLVVQQRGIGNAERQVERAQIDANREQARFEAGLIAPFEAAAFQNELFDGQERLNQSIESYRLAVDRFKVRLGMHIDTEVEIIPGILRLPIPDTTTAQAVQRALSYRLDLQTRRDGLDDSRRDVNNAKNDLLPDLDLSASTTIPTNSDRGREGVDFRPNDSDFSVGLSMSLPLDREIEKYSLREAQIGYERAVRSYDEFRDNLIVTVRAAVRDIDRRLLSLDIQRENVRAAQIRQASIEADPARASVTERTDSASALQAARDALDSAVRDVEVAILNYLLETGQLRVGADGAIKPLENMELTDELSEYIQEVMGEVDTDEPTVPGQGPGGPPPGSPDNLLNPPDGAGGGDPDNSGNAGDVPGDGNG